MKSALIVVDMLNEYDHEDAEVLVENVRAALPAMRGLVERADEDGTPIVYVNDNYGDWGAGPAGDRRARDRAVAPAISSSRSRPPRARWFISKARHSIFYETQLEYLLREQEIERVVLVGQVTEQCILYSALDAYVRHFDAGGAVRCRRRDPRRPRRRRAAHDGAQHARGCHARGRLPPVLTPAAAMYHGRARCALPDVDRRASGTCYADQRTTEEPPCRSHPGPA